MKMMMLASVKTAAAVVLTAGTLGIGMGVAVDGSRKVAPSSPLASGDARPAKGHDAPILFTDGLKPYEVHEWGVFSVYPGVRYANVDMAAEWSELPAEMYRSFPEVRLPYFGPVRKPIIYFHWNSPSAPDHEFQVTTTFTDGRPVVWFHATSEPVYRGLRPIELSQALTWNLRLREPAGFGFAPYPEFVSLGLRSGKSSLRRAVPPLNSSRIQDCCLSAVH